jgi:hypothetical protein
MPFLALAGPIAGLLGASAATASTIGAVGAGVGAIASGIQSKNAANKAASSAADAGRASQVDINELQERVRAISRQNALDSAELERQLTPEVPALRTSANQGVLAGLTPDASSSASTNMLMQGLGNKFNFAADTPLLQAAIAKAKANLALGGSLDVDTQNAVTRRGLATAGTVAPGTLGLGRDVVARDLGLTSLQLQQQRLGDATQLGGMEAQGAQFGAQFDATNMLNKIQMLRAISDSNYQRQLSAAQYAQQIRQPIIGLDPSSIANISIGNQNSRSAALANQADIYGKQANNYATGAGQALGYGLLNYITPAKSPVGQDIRL